MTTLPIDGVERHFLHRGFGLEFEMEAAYIQRHLPSDRRWIVDVGCGIGGLFDVIGRDRVIGLDGLADGLKKTRAGFPEVPLMVADADRLPFTAHSIHTITAQHLVEHLPSFQSTCKEWQRVLKPGGRLIIATPNDAFVDPKVFDDPSHIQIFDVPSLRSTLEAVGFEIVDMRTLGLPWFRKGSAVPGAWRLRRLTLSHAQTLSRLWRIKSQGQTLCCVARKSV